MPIFEGVKRAGIWGFGREGRAAFDHIRARYPHIDIAILNDTPLPAGPGAPAIAGPDVAKALVDGSLDIVVKSPGVSLYRPEIAEAKRRGARFTSATNIWFEENRGAFKIVVTGTKGKSTTSRLLERLLLDAGKETMLAGNIGIPVLGESKPKDYVILELSSYQIADLDFAPNLALVTNLYPEHAPWHRGVENYYSDKLRILGLSPETPAICNYSNRTLRERVGMRENIRWFNGDDGYRVRDGQLLFDNERIDCAGFPLKGEHNLINLAGACAAADALGVRQYRRSVDLRSFKQLDHRLQEFRIGAGLLCVNDSIATVPEATLAALKAYPGHDIVLFLGGADRGQDYTALIGFLPKTRVKKIILLPPVGERLFAQLSQSEHHPPALCAANLDEGVAEAMRGARDGDVLLLSPAAPSFGQFRDFEERGRAFMDLCARHGTKA
ncbi:MAG: UDP-N-acetylmuramoyl-L-alanine--D-glutamate ligase [Rhodomicrobium sp.]